MKKLNGLIVLDPAAYNVVYAPGPEAEIARRVDLVAPAMSRRVLAANLGVLSQVDVIFSGWGCPRMDEAFLDAAPHLKAVFYAAGAINGWCTSAVWERGITVTTANYANAIPVAEYTVASILFALKNGFRLSRDRSGPQAWTVRNDITGNYRSVIGLIGCGTVSRLVLRMLEPFGVRVHVYDPYLSTDEAALLGVTLVESLEQLFSTCDVVSLHAPDIASTHGMVTGKLLASMKRGATFINTARGRTVREAEMCEVLASRPDLQAIIDVTTIEPLPADSPLHRLPNITHTPHIAGSQGRECTRMGDHMVDELDRYLAGRPLRWEVRPEGVAHSVHEMHLTIGPAARARTSLASSS